MLGLQSYQSFSWQGVVRRRGIDFKHNRWIFFLVLAALMGTCSGLLDKFLMASQRMGGVGLDRMIDTKLVLIFINT